MNLNTQTDTPKLRRFSSSSLDSAGLAETIYTPLHNNPLHTHTLLQLASSQRATQRKLTRSNYGGEEGETEKRSECVCVRKTERLIERAKRNMKEKERARSFPPSIH